MVELISVSYAKVKINYAIHGNLMPFICKQRASQSTIIVISLIQPIGNGSRSSQRVLVLVLELDIAVSGNRAKKRWKIEDSSSRTTVAMVGNSSLFVMFGNDSDGNAHDDFHILDVSNWAWQASFSLTQASNISQPNNSTDFGSGSSDSKALSGGAIAGIVIGCLAAASDRSIIFYSFRQD